MENQHFVGIPSICFRGPWLISQESLEEMYEMRLFGLNMMILRNNKENGQLRHLIVRWVRDTGIIYSYRLRLSKDLKNAWHYNLLASINGKPPLDWIDWFSCQLPVSFFGKSQFYASLLWLPKATRASYLYVLDLHLD